MFRKHFDYDVEAASNAAAVFPEGESLTVQSMAEDADINVIVKRFGLTGKMPENPHIPMYGDFEGVGDYRTALDAVMAADAAFMELTAEVRARFANDPQRLMDFVANGENRAEAVKLGLLKPVQEASAAAVGSAAPAAVPPAVSPVVPPAVPAVK